MVEIKRTHCPLGIFDNSSSVASSLPTTSQFVLDEPCLEKVLPVDFLYQVFLPSRATIYSNVSFELLPKNRVVSQQSKTDSQLSLYFFFSWLNDCKPIVIPTFNPLK